MISERLQELVELYIGEEIAGEDAAELRGLIERDPAALAFFAREARLALVIAAQLRVGTGLSLGDRVRSVSEADRPSRRARMVRSIAARTRGTRPAIRRPAVLAMAALLMVAVVSWMASLVLASPGHPAWEVGAGAPGQLLRDGTTSPLDAATALRVGDEVVVQGLGGTITAADGSAFALRAGTRVRLEDEAVVAVLAGSIHADIVHRPGQHLRFTAGDTRIDILGTSFSFGFEPSGVGLVVERGSVAFAGSTDHQALVVTDGQRALAQPRRAARIMPSPAASPARVLIPAGDPGRWAASASRGSTASVEPATDARGAACVRFTATLSQSSGTIPWGTLTSAPLSLRSDDRALRIALRVAAAGPSSSLCIDLTDRAGDVWRIAQWPVAGSEAWNAEVIPLPPLDEAPWCVHPRSAAPAWDLGTVVSLTVVAFGDASVCEVGEVGIHGR